jgi:large subunit ribosomal protein L21
VLLLVDGENIAVGTPRIDDVKVGATVVEHILGPKIVVFKYSPRKRIRVKRGHRQQYTRLMIDEIIAAKPAKKAKADTEEAKPKVEAPSKSPAKKEASSPKKKTETKKSTTDKKPAAKKSSTKKSSEK